MDIDQFTGDLSGLTRMAALLGSRACEHGPHGHLFQSEYGYGGKWIHGYPIVFLWRVPEFHLGQYAMSSIPMALTGQWLAEAQQRFAHRRLILDGGDAKWQGGGVRITTL